MTNLYFQAYPEIEQQEMSAITQFDDELQDKIAQLFQTMEEGETWCLAGPQVGIHLPIFVLSASDYLDSKACFINPKITHQEGETAYTSNCLYFPGVETVIKRPKKITISYVDEKGQPQEMVAQDALAAILAYQVDCLHGILVTDHMSKLKKEIFLKKYFKAMSQQSCGQSCDHAHH